MRSIYPLLDFKSTYDQTYYSDTIKYHVSNPKHNTTMLPRDGTHDNMKSINYNQLKSIKNKL